MTHLIRQVIISQARDKAFSFGGRLIVSRYRTDSSPPLFSRRFLFPPRVENAQSSAKTPGTGRFLPRFTSFLKTGSTREISGCWFHHAHQQSSDSSGAFPNRRLPPSFGREDASSCVSFPFHASTDNAETKDLMSSRLTRRGVTNQLSTVAGSFFSAL